MTLKITLLIAACIAGCSIGGNEARDTATVSVEVWKLVLWAVGALVALTAVRLIWESVLMPIARRTKTNLDIMILQGTVRPAQWTAFLIVLNMASYACFQNTPEVSTYVLWTVSQKAIFSLLVFSIAAIVYGVTKAFVEWHAERVAVSGGMRLDNRFTLIFRKAAKFVFFFIAVTIVLDHFGIQVSGLLATAGIASLAVAFAAQETLSNMISGLVMLLDRPFSPGDRIELADGKVGDVLDVGLRSTKIVSFDNTVINMPNSEIAKAQVVNISAPDATYRIRSSVGVAYGTDLRKVKTILFDIMRSHAEVLEEPEPAVFFTEFGDSALKMFFACSVADYRNQFRVRDELNMGIKDRFEEQGIEIPFPQRVVHIQKEK